MPPPGTKTGATPERLALAAEVKRLRAEGLIFREIAERLGLSYGYTNSLFHDPDGAKDRARKASYAGVCVDCGGPTCGSGGKDNRSKRCSDCHKNYLKSAEYAAEHTTWSKERIIEAIRWWTEEHGDPPSVTDWNPYELSSKFGGMPRARYARKLFQEGKVPWFTSVIRQFGSWNNAIVAAGYTPRKPHFPGPGKSRTFSNGRPQRRT